LLEFGPAPDQYTAVVRFVAIASTGLGFASPFIAGALVPVEDALALHGLMYGWFYGIPGEVLTLIPLQDGTALFAAIGLLVVEYFVLFTVLVGMGWLVKWTFSSTPSVVTAHILDARDGYSVQRLAVGREVERETA